MPYRYQGRADQERAIAQAHHWLERLAQLAQFENVVLRKGPEAGDGRPAEPSAPAARERRLE